ncbi:DNA gyrase subunit A [Paenibacillus antri]|uniref:DNA topoisomerase (ATP-hydrolyzing) n=1 Tax=Paenibacillus antri TaxID=2582848 RepID=A0A5R9GMJ0_9BACL|nr:DNA gyrase subunit A [Paenibacillus antri]TLS53175.1 DNA gyrase subunit A [Paenibacillus antri]
MGTLEQFMPVVMEEVVGERFGRYSKYIIQDRAIPDVRDGLKPVQRRILYAMYEAGNTPDKPYRKSAKTVGDVMGNYHPHGDSSIYEGMVRMAQPWKMAHPLVDGHGNWGSMDDDPAAAMRYTEARLSKIALELLRDIEKRTVQFRDNFDNTTKEPAVLPSRYPNLLVNGVSGISAGFATEIPTHNLREVIDACIKVIEDPFATVEDLMGIVRGPDFPTGGTVMGTDGIREAYNTGRGRVFIRSRTAIEDLRGGKQQIVITEIPYGVVKSKLVTAMETIRIEKKVEGIAEVRDESGRNGLRIVVELKKDADAQGILTYLLKKTDLQIAYNFNMVAIVNKTPKQLGLKEMLVAYVEHQKDVVTRRSRHDLEKAEDRAHVLEGLAKALDILDEVVATIRRSKNRQDAQNNLIAEYGFTERQSDAILTLQLYRLTNLEITSIEKELDEVRKLIAHLRGILGSEMKLLGVIKKELLEIRAQFGIDRRSEIQDEIEELKVSLEVMVTPEDVLVTLSDEGYIKRTSKLSFTRSGGEIEKTGLKEGDFVRELLEVNTIDNLLLFTDKGQYFVLPVHAVPEYKWKDNGTALVNVVPIAKEDRVVAVIPVKDMQEVGRTLLFATKRGQIKRSELKEYATNRTTAIAAVKLAEGDEVIAVWLDTPASTDVLVVTKLGQSIRFSGQEVNTMGRVAAGVRAIALREGDEVVAALPVRGDEGEVLVLSDLGYAKRSLLADYNVQGRGGKGIATFEFKEGKRVKPNGNGLICAVYVRESAGFVAVTKAGKTSGFSSESVPISDLRATGSSVVPVDKGDEVVALVSLKIEG